MKEGILTGHRVHAGMARRNSASNTLTVAFWCEHCDLYGNITAPSELAEATVADLMATHWAATGGERS